MSTSKPVLSCGSRRYLILTIKLFVTHHFNDFSIHRNIFPPNLVQATIQQYQTVLKPLSQEEATEQNVAIDDMTFWKITGQYTDGRLKKA